MVDTWPANLTPGTWYEIKIDDCCATVTTHDKFIEHQYSDDPYTLDKLRFERTTITRFDAITFTRINENKPTE